MKFVASLILGLTVAATAMADIQQPPASDYGPTRKLGRALSNICFGSSELINSFVTINYDEGNSAAWSYGIVQGLGRTFERFGYGWYELALFPFPTHNGTYYPPYKSDIPWIYSGIQEFPPELGWETRYDYCREYDQDPSL
jgi:putative exosortase-associated protein (TIGR04073 family)